MKKLFAALVLISLGVTSLMAQENMPYSRYGLGNLQSQQFQGSMGMGNCSTTFQNEFMQNPANPASYSYLANKTVTFEAALQGRQNILRYGNNSSSYFDMAPSHVGIAAMVMSKEKLKWGMGFTLLPYSKIAYNVEEDGNSKISPSILKQKFQGSGEIYKVQWSNGIKYKHLQLGLNVGYLFGSRKDNVIAYYPDSIYALASVYSKIQNVHGLNWQGGAQYTIPLKKEQKIILGATFGTMNSLTSKMSETWFRINNAGTVIDTAKHISDVSGKVILPQNFTLGAQWAQGRNWGIAFEYASAAWSTYKNNGQTDSFKNNYTMALGAFFTPDPLATQILKRCIYKVGVGYGTDPLYLRNKQFNTVHVTVGFSMPVLFKAEEGRPMYMLVHANLESTSKTNSVSTIISENSFRFNIGATISGNWFQKRKYD
jgi:hypothetical protein